MFLYKYSIQ